MLAQKEYILNNFESQRLTLGIFIDFSKAFDTVNHKILIAKLEHYGVRGHALNLIKSYLSSRLQYVVINHSRSDSLQIFNGVPQGSILGPLLFNIYINDISNISTLAKYVIYADDTSLFFSSSDVEQLTGTANRVLALLSRWSLVNSLKINKEKTKAVIFRPKGKLVMHPPPLVLSDTIIEYVETFRSLGVSFTATMTWDAHINEVCLALSKVVGITSRNKYVLPEKTKLTLYYAFFYSYLSYCFLVWGNTTTSNIQKLLILQKKMLRAITKAPYNSPTGQAYSQFKIVPVYNLFEYRFACFYKNSIAKNDNFLSRIVSTVPHNTPYATREKDSFVLPRCRTNYGFTMLRYILPKFLNTPLCDHLNGMSSSVLRNAFL